MSRIIVEKAAGIGTVTLNRPEKLNAFFETMREELLEALGDLDVDPSIRSVILTGAGRAFCAGGDVDTMRQLQKEGRTAEFRAFLELGRDIVLTLRRMPKIVIAAIHGVAAGAGCNLALACDYRIAAEDARLGETFVRIGLHPDWGGTWFVPRLAGPSAAIELMASGRMIDALEAKQLGLVDRVVAREHLMGEAEALARTFADGPSHAIAGIKAAVYASWGNSLEQQLDLESENQAAAFESRDAVEGITAFFEKRTPQFL